MKRIEYNLYRRLRSDLKKFSGEGTTLTIAVNDMGVEFKRACHDLYMANGFHPANVRVDSHYFDDELRVIYVYGLTWEDAEGRPHSWEELYTDVERACFEVAISNEYHDMTAAEIWKSVTTAKESDTAETEKEDHSMNSIKEKVWNVSFDAMREYIEDEKRGRSAWYRGVKDYALELLENLEDGVMGQWIDVDKLFERRGLREALLNGARDWSEYSRGGGALIYDGHIAERLCCPSELKKVRGGERRPNAREDWIDVQARALFQAAQMVHRALMATSLRLEYYTTVDGAERVRAIPAAQAV